MTRTSSRIRQILSLCLAPHLIVLGLCTALLFLSRSHALAASPSTSDAVRLLEQTTFGPTSELIAHVQQIGSEAFLEEQFNLPLPAYPDLGQWPQKPPDTCDAACKRDNYTMYPLQVRFFQNALTTPDQLRQRVTFALNQIFVISAQDNDLRLPSRMLPYLQVLDRNAFGNFRQLLSEITLNPGMGRYLDMAGNKAEAPNENYARELLQLFTIGLYELNSDGTPKLDANGNRIPTYTQETVTAFARVFTGWVLAPPPQPGLVNYFDPMIPGSPRSHDAGEKQLLNGVTLPAERSAEADLNTGHLREPVLWITSLLRAFHTTEVTTDFVLGESFLPSDIRMSEDLFRAPSVFNFFPPGYVIPGESLQGPEFAIQSTATALARTNFAYEVIYHKMPTNPSVRPKGTWLDLSSLEPLANDPQQLVETLDSLMLHGMITPQMRSTIETSVARIAAADPAARVQDAVYLVSTSPQYLIER